jgi:hypothetical protein
MLNRFNSATQHKVIPPGNWRDNSIIHTDGVWGVDQPVIAELPVKRAQLAKSSIMPATNQAPRAFGGKSFKHAIMRRSHELPVHRMGDASLPQETAHDSLAGNIQLSTAKTTVRFVAGQGWQE